MKKTIINTIASYAHVSVEDMKNINTTVAGNCFGVTFDCDLLHYDCYVDASGEVLGFMFAPIAYESSLAA